MKTRVAACCLTLLLAVVGSASGVTRHVPSEYPTIQGAVNSAVYGDVIEIAAGTFDDVTHMADPPDDSTLCVAVIKTSGLTFRGAGMGMTFVDGDSTGRGFYLQDVEDIVIEDITFTRAFAETYGAGIMCVGSSPRISRVEVTGNYDGGITLSSGSSPVIEYCVMSGNEAKAGGGIDIHAGCEPHIVECDILDNRAPFAAGMQILGSPKLVHCRIDGNETVGAANTEGGGILIKDGAAPVFTYCSITNNVCYGDGAGVSVDGAMPEFYSCQIIGNYSTGDEGRGGGFYMGSESTVIMEFCLLADNYTTMDAWYSDGGGMWVNKSNLEMRHCTLWGNWSGGERPDYGNIGNLGIATSMFIPATIEISHCLVGGSSRGAGVVCSGSGEEPMIDCCNVFGNEGGNDVCGVGADNFSLDPLLCDVPTDNYRLQASSPCAGGGHPSGPETCDGMVIGSYGRGCSVDVEEPEFPVSAMLLSNQPNPFDRATTISFHLSGSAAVSLEVLDVAGRRVATLHNGMLPAGPHQIVWDGTTDGGQPVGSGVYFSQLRTGDQVHGRRMLHLQ